MLTRDQLLKLQYSIDAAADYAMCAYQKNGAPCCVMGQLAHREGVSVEELERWDGLDASENDIRQIRPSELQSYPMTLLMDLQILWDCGSIPTDNQTDMNSAQWARAQMHTLVKRHLVREQIDV